MVLKKSDRHPATTSLVNVRSQGDRSEEMADILERAEAAIRGVL